MCECAFTASPSSLFSASDHHKGKRNEMIPFQTLTSEQRLFVCVRTSEVASSLTETDADTEWKQPETVWIRVALVQQAKSWQKKILIPSFSPLPEGNLLLSIFGSRLSLKSSYETSRGARPGPPSVERETKQQRQAGTAGTRRQDWTGMQMASLSWTATTAATCSLVLSVFVCVCVGANDC